MFSRITIVGLGLIGGSVARTIRARYPYTYLTAFDTSYESLKKAITLGLIDRPAADLRDAISETDLIVLCTPLSSYAECVAVIKSCASSTTLITDAGSVKQCMVTAFESLAQQCVPAHPIAGKAESGIEASEADLFQGKRIILTPIFSTALHTIHQIQRFWEELGGNVEEMPALQHDNWYAALSHLPQALLFCEGRIPQGIPTSPALEQHFRIAHSNPAIWADIFVANAHALIPLLERIAVRLPLLTNQDIEAARLTRQTLNDSLINLGQLPPLSYLVAAFLMECVPNIFYAGSGFRDATACLLSYKCNPSAPPSKAFQTTFLLAVHNITRLIRNQNIRELAQYLRH